MFECPRWTRGPYLLATKEINRIGHSCHSQGRLIVCFLAKALFSQYLALTSATLTNPSHDASVPLTAPWVPPPTSQLQCVARRRLVLARQAATLTASLCNSPAHTLSTDYTISFLGNYMRKRLPAHPTTTSQHIVLTRFAF